MDNVLLYAKNNAAEHRTVRYELVHRQPETAISRRGQPFTFIIRFTDGKSFSSDKDVLSSSLQLWWAPVLYAYSGSFPWDSSIPSFHCPGPAPSVIKHTQGILTVKGNEEFSKENDQWDVRAKTQTPLLCRSVGYYCHNSQIFNETRNEYLGAPTGSNTRGHARRYLEFFTGEVDSTDKLFRLYDVPNDIYIPFNPWCQALSITSRAFR